MRSDAAKPMCSQVDYLAESSQNFATLSCSVKYTGSVELGLQWTGIEDAHILKSHTIKRMHDSENVSHTDFSLKSVTSVITLRRPRIAESFSRTYQCIIIFPARSGSTTCGVKIVETSVTDGVRKNGADEEFSCSVGVV